MQTLLVVLVAIVLFMMLKGDTKESWGTSPGVFDQLASTSSYYPYWRYGYGYRRPWWRYGYRYPGWGSYYRRSRPWMWY